MAMFAAFPSTILEAAMGAHGEPMVARTEVGVSFRANGPQVQRLPTKSSLLLFARGFPGYPEYPRVPPATLVNGVRNRCSDPTSTHTGGQDDMS